MPAPAADPGAAPPDPDGPVDYHTYLKRFNPNWNCSEPKALAAAARSGQGIEGMTTFYFGRADDEVFRRYRLDTVAAPDANVLLWQPFSVRRAQHPPHRLPLCRPCDTCSLNEHMVMSRVGMMDLIARGGGNVVSRSIEAPARLQGGHM